jgi:hypothetical protein
MFTKMQQLLQYLCHWYAKFINMHQILQYLLQCGMPVLNFLPSFLSKIKCLVFVSVLPSDETVMYLILIKMLQCNQLHYEDLITRCIFIYRPYVCACFSV